MRTKTYRPVDGLVVPEQMQQNIILKPQSVEEYFRLREKAAKLSLQLRETEESINKIEKELFDSIPLSKAVLHNNNIILHTRRWVPAYSWKSAFEGLVRKLRKWSARPGRLLKTELDVLLDKEVKRAKNHGGEHRSRMKIMFLENVDKLRKRDDFTTLHAPMTTTSYHKLIKEETK